MDSSVIVELIVVVGAIFGGGGFWNWMSARSSKKNDVGNKIDSMSADLSSMKSDVSDMKSDINTLKADVNALKTDVNTLKTDVNTLKSDFTSLKSDVSTLSGDINDLKTLYDELSKAQIDYQTIAQQDKVNYVEALTGLMRERLLENYYNCIRKGYYTKAERETYGAMFKCYTSKYFDGDGVIHDLEPIMKALPWTDPNDNSSDSKE